MLIYKNYVWQSDILNINGVNHGFSTREGGISELPHTASMNVGFHRGDDNQKVLENIRLLTGYAGVSDNVVCSHQIHSDIIRTVTLDNGGEGITRDEPFFCDGFITDQAGITLMIKVADCVPILLAGAKPDGMPVIAAVHAGWRGTVAGIAPKAVLMMREMGAADIRAAIGVCIHRCCYQVGDDFVDAVMAARGADFAARYIVNMHANLPAMNEELLWEAGVQKIDVATDCTACKPTLYHSHRITGGKRGTMGAVIGIREKELG